MMQVVSLYLRSKAKRFDAAPTPVDNVPMKGRSGSPVHVDESNATDAVAEGEGT